MQRNRQVGRRDGGHVGLLLAVCAVLAAAMFLSGGVRRYAGTPGREAEIAANRARLEQMQAKEPVDLNAEIKRRRKELLAAKNGILVDDLQAEQQRILAMTDGDWNKADFVRWFEHTAIVGDSIIRQVRLYHLLDAPVFSKAGVHLTSDMPLIDTVIEAGPEVVFLCFGMNDVGIFKERVNLYVERYSRVIRKLQDALPDAVIYVCAALPVTAERMKEEPKYQYIDLYNAEMEKACPDLGVYFIDSGFILRARQNLYNVDGRHPKEDYYNMWLTYLADCVGLKDE